METETLEAPATPAAETVAVAPEPAKVVVVETTQTPEQLKSELAGAQARIHELNKENEKRRKAQEAADAAAKTADEARLAEQGEFKTLAETRTAELAAATASLTSATDKLTRLDTIVGADIEKRVAAWPDEVKVLIPKADSADALTRLERVTELEPLATRLMTAKPAAGNSAGPVPGGARTPEMQKEAQQAQANATRRAF